MLGSWGGVGESRRVMRKRRGILWMLKLRREMLMFLMLNVRRSRRRRLIMRVRKRRRGRVRRMMMKICRRNEIFIGKVFERFKSKMKRWV